MALPVAVDAAAEGRGEERRVLMAKEKVMFQTRDAKLFFLRHRSSL